jgi:hypothetical protein
MNNSIIITEDDLAKRKVYGVPHNLRSLEKLLEKYNRKFECNDFEKTIEVEVLDKDDAVNFSTQIGLNKARYINNGKSEELIITAPSKRGRPKDSVFIGTAGQNELKMTTNQFKKYSLQEIQLTHLTKTQIIRMKILTKTQLEKYLNSGELKHKKIYNRTYIDQKDLASVI